MESINRRDNVMVYLANSMLRAMVVRDVLEKIGIPVSMQYEKIEYAHRKESGSCGEVSLMVPPECKEQAHAVLNAVPPQGEIFCYPKAE